VAACVQRNKSVAGREASRTFTVSVYDALDRLVTKTYPDSSQVEYVYDLVGKIQSVNDPTGTNAFRLGPARACPAERPIARCEGVW
jgi:YD repeat-containing protein